MSPRISIRLLAAQPDQRLLALASDGHERAFEALVHRYRRPLLRYARRIGLAEARAEDVVQQAFMKAWIALDRGDEVRDPRSWLYRIVHNAALNALRGPAEAHGELTEAVEDRAALVGASNLERRIALREALSDVAALPRMQRQAIFLTAVDGQSHDEVAGRLGITPGAVRGLLHRARTTLRSAAAAVIPQPLLELAARGGETGAPAALELAGGAGAAGLLLKAGVAVVTAGTLAAGAGVVASHDQGGAAHARSQAAPALRASVQQGPGSKPLVVALGPESAGFDRPGGAKADRRGQGHRRAGRSGRGGGGGDRSRGRHSRRRRREPSHVTLRGGSDDGLVAGSVGLRRGDDDHRGRESSRSNAGGNPEASDADRGRRHHDRRGGQGSEPRRQGEHLDQSSSGSEETDGTSTPADGGGTSGSGGGSDISSGGGSSGSGGGQSGGGSDSDGQAAQPTPVS